ncbi:TonB family protein [Tritonibacter mobilis]|uniref:TonB family protein n=1 Tax=Tritonibacter mobilis TaxID=379347 RepID=UPI00399036BB
MIARSPFIAGLSLCFALAAHAAFLVDVEDNTVELEGGGNVAPAALGDSFADLAQGTATSVEAETVSETAQVEPMVPTEPDRATSPQVQPVTPEVTVPKSAQSASAVVPVTSLAAAVPVEQQVTEVQPDQMEPVEEPSDLAPAQSPRPETRPDPEPDQPDKAKPRQAAPRGNSTVDARAGTESGAENQRAAQAASTRPAQGSGAGNAAASNYQGLVMRKIFRVRKPRTSVKGVAHVSFVIGGGGQLASVRIRKSSGSSELDQLALQQIRKAAPFPPPPAGARTQFSIAIKGR